MNTRTFAGLLVLAVLFWGCDSPVKNTTVTTAEVVPPSAPSITISSISPAAAKAGSPDVVVTITGNNFGGPYSKTYWAPSNAVPQGWSTVLDTRSVSATQLTAIVHADLLRSAGTARVFVVTKDRMGDGPGRSSNAVPFTISP